MSEPEHKTVEDIIADMPTWTREEFSFFAQMVLTRHLTHNPPPSYTVADVRRLFFAVREEGRRRREKSVDISG